LAAESQAAGVEAEERTFQAEKETLAEVEAVASQRTYFAMVLDHLSEEVEEEYRQLLLKLVKCRFWLYQRHTLFSWAGHVWHWNVIVALNFFGARWKTRRKRYVIFIFVWGVVSE